VRIEGDAVYVRDTKRDDGGILAFTREEWASFVAGVRLGEFDLDLNSEGPVIAH
jgi:hypothetical protein